MFRCVSAIVIFFAADAALDAQVKLPAAENQVAVAALDAYVAQMYGSNGRFLLYQTTVKPSPVQLEVHVFSPANDDGARRYAVPDIVKLRRDIQSAPRASMMLQSPRYVTGIWRRKQCREFRRRGFIDALSVSRAVFDGSNSALIYLEYNGGARAYYLLRREGRWESAWYVELWACG
jgi:hypothetical protein